MYNSVIRYLDNLCFCDIAIETEKRKITYKEYRLLSRKIGTYISDRTKEKRNNPIAVYIPKDERALEVYMGILYSGNYYCPIPYNSPDERARQMLKILKRPYIITTKDGEEKILNWGGNKENIILYEEAITCDEDIKSIENILNQVISCDPAYLLFTSGSTGIPKGVVISHGAIMDRITWMADTFGINDKNVLASQAPFHFDASMPDIYLNIIAKAKLIIAPENLSLFPLELLSYLAERNVNTLIWVPSALINLTHKNVIQKCRLKELKLVIFCGEVMPTKYLNRIRDVYENTLFVNMYGPTEAAYACTYKIVKRTYTDQEVLPIGSACGNTEVFLLDDDNHTIVEENVQGEICVRGLSVALGYYNDSEHLAFQNNIRNECFYTRVYKTGDIGYWNSHKELMYVGRKDSQIKLRGYRIELGEIETAVLGMDSIQYACVLYDSVRQKIILFYESNDGMCDKKLIVQEIQSMLPKYMYPQEYIKLEKMPFNMNGKIDRIKLKKMIAEGV